ncbi:MAG: hypothetical protein ABI199_01720 [Bacteroidia bacterium]
MKIITLSLMTLLFWSNPCHAAVDSVMITHFRQITKLIESNNVQELSKFVDYPLKRENPLPDIKNAADFISDYPILIDSLFKKLLNQYNDSDIFEHNGYYGFIEGKFSGAIWLDEDGNIVTINYSSKAEQKAKQLLIEKIKKEMYPTVNKWNENVLVAKSEKLLIRIDQTDKGVRYVCWSKAKTMKDAPDIILNNGVEDGGEWGWTSTFKNGDWTYIVDDVEMCEDDHPDECGLFLELSFKGEKKNTIRLQEIK